MTTEQWAIAGILATVIFGVPALFAVKNIRTKKQNQKVGPGSTAFQAGRDISLNDDDW